MKRLRYHACIWERIGEAHPTYRDAPKIADMREAADTITSLIDVLNRLFLSQKRYGDDGNDDDVAHARAALEKVGVKL